MKEQIGLALIDAINSVKNSDLLTGATLLAAAGSIIAMVWAYGRKAITFVYGRIERLIMYRVTLEYFDDMYWYLEAWLRDNYSGKYRNVIAYIDECEIADEMIPSDYDTAECYGKGPEEDKSKKIVRYKHHSDFITINQNGRRIFIRKNREKNESATTLKALFYDSFYISTLFGRRAIKSFLDTVLQYNLDRIKTKTNVTVYTRNWGQWHVLKGIVPKDTSTIFLNDNLKDQILGDIDKFIRSESYYMSKGIPYKRGYLFYGDPGNGKTTLATSIAFHTKRNLYVMNLASVENDNDLINAFVNLMSGDSIILIEDIDSMFSSERKIEKNKINFSTLLNCLDGAFYRHGLITIMTTNHIDRLDRAMIRKGRIDFEANISIPHESTAKEYVESFYDDGISLNGEFKNNQLPMSTIQELCIDNTPETFRAAINNLR